MKTIVVRDLKKYYRVYEKEAGFLGSVKSLIYRNYRESKAVDNISFEIEEGELVGFIGPNGAGKTTTLKCLSGLLYPTSGKVSVLSYTPFERDHKFLRQIALVMGQKNQLWWDLPAIESFALNREIYQIPQKKYSQVLEELSTLLEVTDVLHVQVRKLSLGQRMKCELIAALLHNPRVLFLDEPTIGLDVVMQKKLRDFIREYNRDYNSTILLTSHYMDDVKELCHRVIIIDHGRILYDGSLDNIVKKYAPYKLITAILHKKVDRTDLKKMGNIVEYTMPKLTLSVPREESNHVAAKLLEKFPVKDLNIEEPDIEGIIRDVFANGGS